MDSIEFMNQAQTRPKNNKTATTNKSKMADDGETFHRIFKLIILLPQSKRISSSLSRTPKTRFYDIGARRDINAGDVDEN